MVEEAKANGGDGSEEDTLTYAMFPKVAPKFFKERVNGPVSSDSFVVKAAPAAAAPSQAGSQGGSYSVTVNGTAYNVTTGPAGDVMSVNVNGTAYNVSFGAPGAAPVAAAPVVSGGASITAPVAGTLLKHVVPSGTTVKKGDTVVMIESMKMELEVKATADGPVTFTVQPGTQIAAGEVIGTIGGGVVQPVASVPVAAPAPAAAPVAPATPSGAGTVVAAPVAGTLLKTMVAEGAAVKSGDTIIMIESMKMELEIKAASNGAVHFLCSAGSQISAGQALAEIR